MTPAELRATLDRLGLSQVRLAALLSQSPVTVNRWLSGARDVPKWMPTWLAMYEQLTPKQRQEIWPE